MHGSRGPSPSLLDVRVTPSSASDCAWHVSPQSCWAVWDSPPSSSAYAPLLRGPGYALGYFLLLALILSALSDTDLYNRERGWSLPIGVFSVLTLTEGTPTSFSRNQQDLNTNTLTAYNLHTRHSCHVFNTLAFQQHSSSMHFEISFALYSAKRFQFFSSCAGIDMM